MKYRILFSILILACGLAACSGDKPVLKKNPAEVTVRDLLEYGRALFSAGYYKDAIREYRKVISQFPQAKSECAWAQYELSYSHYYLKDYDAALHEFRKVEMLYPDERGPVILAQKMIRKVTLDML